MNWSNLIQQVIQLLIGSSAVAAVVIFLGKKIVELLLSKDLEKFKADLQKESVRFQIKYQALHSERAIVIETLYEKIVIAEEKLSSLISPFQSAREPPLHQKAKKAASSINDLVRYFDRKKIFFDEKVEKAVEKMIEVYKSSFYHFDYSQVLKGVQAKEFIKEWSEAWKKFNKESLRTKRVIEKEFRIIIGVKNQ